MRIHTTKKITAVIERLQKFIRLQFPKIGIIFVTLAVLLLIKRLPYINLITHYNAYALGTVLVLVIFLFRDYLSKKVIAISLGIVIGMALMTKILHVESIAELLGFIIFTIVGIFVIIMIIRERSDLADSIEE